MSRVPFTINVDRYICDELECIRRMLNTRDFSGLSAAVERIQIHASAMESAIYTRNDTINDIYRAANKVIEDKQVEPSKLIAAVKKIRKMADRRDEQDDD